MFFLIVLIYVLLSFSVGSLLLWLAFDYWRAIQIITAYLNEFSLSESNLFVLASAGFLVILACIAFLRRLGMASRREKSIVLQDAGGNVSISVSAIEDMIKKILEDKKELSHVKPKIKFTRRGIEVLIRSALTSEVNLTDFANQIRKEVVGRLEGILGEGTNLKVNLEIKKLALPARREIAEVEPQVPFRNY